VNVLIQKIFALFAMLEGNYAGLTMIKIWRKNYEKNKYIIWYLFISYL